MEKKNTILLTVIAIATLLVAVVGATFAYFTAQVTTNNDDQNTTTVNTATVANAKMDMGAKVTANDIYPGAQAVKYVDVTGSCQTGVTNCTATPANITVTQNIDTAFGTDVTWKLYKVAAGTEIGCRNVVSTAAQTPNVAGQTTTTDVRYTMTTTCKAGITQTDADALNLSDPTDQATWVALQAPAYGTAVLSSDDITDNVAKLKVDVNDATNDRYYLVVDYADNGDQNAQQDKSFTITIGFEPIA